MKTKKIKLGNLTVQSFVTVIKTDMQNTIQGAADDVASDGIHGFCPSDIHPGACSILPGLKKPVLISNGNCGPSFGLICKILTV